MGLWSAFQELDSLYETADKKRWSFTGKVEFFSKGNKGHITITTPIFVNGNSEKEALNHVMFVIKKDNKLPIDSTKINILDCHLKPIQPAAVSTTKNKATSTDNSGFIQLSFDDLILKE